MLRQFEGGIFSVVDLAFNRVSKLLSGVHTCLRSVVKRTGKRVARQIPYRQNTLFAADRINCLAVRADGHWGNPLAVILALVLNRPLRKKTKKHQTLVVSLSRS